MKTIEELFEIQDRYDLAKKELRLYYYLSTHAGKVCTRKELIENCWNGEKPTLRTIDVFIRRLRLKIPNSRIATIHKNGYIVVVN